MIAIVRALWHGLYLACRIRRKQASVHQLNDHLLNAQLRIQDGLTGCGHGLLMLWQPLVMHLLSAAQELDLFSCLYGPSLERSQCRFVHANRSW